MAHVRNGPFQARSPSAYPPSFHHHSPSLHSPSMSTPPATHKHINDMQPPQQGAPGTFGNPHGPVMSQPPSRHSRGPVPNPAYQSSSMPTAGQGSPVVEYHPPQLPPAYANYPHGGAQAYSSNSNSQGPVLPPFSSIQTMGPPGSQQSNLSVRYHPADNGQVPRQMLRHHSQSNASSSKRHAPPSSNVTSADSSDLDDEENGELPASGLVAPWEVLRGLADVAIERAAKVCVL